MDIATFNSLQKDQQRAKLLECCQCERWAQAVVSEGPFSSLEVLMLAADRLWQEVSEPEILEAFAGHPQIGDLSALRSRYAATASAEQGQVAAADEQTLVALQERNQAYLDRFGFIFIVCATGKSATGMLALLEARINNDRETELANGAREQGRITQLRLQKLFSEEA